MSWNYWTFSVGTLSRLRERSGSGVILSTSFVNYFLAHDKRALSEFFFFLFYVSMTFQRKYKVYSISEWKGTKITFVYEREILLRRIKYSSAQIQRAKQTNICFLQKKILFHLHRLISQESHKNQLKTIIFQAKCCSKKIL